MSLRVRLGGRRGTGFRFQESTSQVSRRDGWFGSISGTGIFERTRRGTKDDLQPLGGKWENEKFFLHL